MRKAIPLALAMLAAGASACATRTEAWREPLPPGEQAALQNEGRQIADARCGGCHAVGQDGASRRQDAPPLRDVLWRYDSAALAGNMMIGVPVGHPDMPLFKLSPRGADALIEYLYAIQVPQLED